MDAPIFISHAHEDRAFVEQLREALEARGGRTWVDVRRLAGGDALTTEILEGIRTARHVLAVISAHTFNSEWVDEEIREGLEVAAKRPGFKVIPLLLPPMRPVSLKRWFGERPVALEFDPAAQMLDDLLPQLFAAFGEALPDVAGPSERARPAVAELRVRLENPEIDDSGGEWRPRASARLIYEPPPDAGERTVESTTFRVRAPIGPIEAGELAWYLERFAVWPSVQFRPRAEAVEASLVRWGRALFEVLDVKGARAVWQAFRATPPEVARCISVEVDPDPPEGLDEAEIPHVREAATLLLGLPWELLRDDRGFLVDGARAVRVRRRLPNRHHDPGMITSTPIRVLLVSPRPEDATAGYIDHRISARPLVEAFMQLGDRVALELLDTPTLAGLSKALADSHTQGRPFHVVHFDGHGVYRRDLGLGMLCFEDPADANKLERRGTKLVSAEELGGIMRDHRIPLVFLEACQSAQTEEDPSASVAGRLLQAGVASVIAMSHSVLVETARRFVEVFYDELSHGVSVGAAMHAAQRGLRDDPGRGRGFYGAMELRDWFVPVLYQEPNDPQVVRELPSQASKESILARAREAVAQLPKRPTHGFVGRSRVLLKIERLLVRERFAVLVGEGGEGKTTIAVELGRWLVESQRFRKAAFVSVEDGSARDVRAVLAKLGEQLVPGFGGEVGDKFWQHLEQALRDWPTLLIFDNMESILPTAEYEYEPEVLEGTLELARRCTEIGRTRVLFTSRSSLPAPFDGNVVRIGRLGRSEAVEIVGKVLERRGEKPAEDDEGGDVELLVDTAQCHARSLVLLAGEIGRVGVRRTTEGLHALMEEMAQRYPEDRERSLFASVELSLRRLPVGVRARIRGLGVFHGGGHGAVIAAVLGLDYAKDEEIELGRQIVEVGLAEQMAYGHLRLHPALPPLLLRELSEAERERARGVWMEAMVGLVGLLDQQQSMDAQVSAVLTLLELPNLLALLDVLRGSDDVERIVDVTTSLETLLQPLGRPRALARVSKVRQEAAGQLRGWSHARALAVGAAIDRLLDAGKVGEAAKQARAHVEQAKAAGESAYPKAPYDLAMAYARLGRVLQMGGPGAQALAAMQEAHARFEALAKGGNASASRMASVCLADMGDCLKDAGRLDEAAKAYEASIEQSEARGDRRAVAVGKGQLGSVRMLQRHHGEALDAYRSARDIFEQLGEPGSVAIAWHQLGMTHRLANQLDAAEQAYQHSLTLKVQQGNRAGEANTLGELGILYAQMGRLEDAARLYTDAATIHADLGDKRHEGTSRNNLANALLQLERHDEAREQLRQAILCKQPFGHVAQLWKTFDILSELERAVGNTDACTVAHQQAIDAYLAYRRDGGENHTPGGRLANAVRQALATNTIDELTPQLASLATRPDLPAYLRAMIPALQQILTGSRDPALASDPALDYDDAAEILLLLES